MVNIVNGSSHTIPLESVILLFGGNGLVGHTLSQLLNRTCKLVTPTHRECDITDLTAVINIVLSVRPHMIINAAAYTAVDEAEHHPNLAFLCNSIGVENIGKAAETIRCPVVHFSSDYVFDGRKSDAYLDNDPPNALNVYGASKAMGERALTAVNSRSIIIRTSWLYGARRAGFIDAVLKQAATREQLEVTSEQVGAPTPVSLVATVAAKIVCAYIGRLDLPADQGFPFGTYNLSCTGSVSRLDYARAIVADALDSGLSLSLAPADIRASSPPSAEHIAKRPANSTLDCAKIQRTFEFQLPHWRGTLRGFLLDRLLQQ